MHIVVHCFSTRHFGPRGPSSVNCTKQIMLPPIHRLTFCSVNGFNRGEVPEYVLLPVSFTYNQFCMIRIQPSP